MKFEVYVSNTRFGTIEVDVESEDEIEEAVEEHLNKFDALEDNGVDVTSDEGWVITEDWNEL